VTVADLRPLVESTVTRHGLPARVVLAQILVESAGNPFAIRPEHDWNYFWDLRKAAAFRRLDPSELRARRAPSDFYGLDGNHQQEWTLQACSIGLAQVMGAVARELGLRGAFLLELVTPAVNIEFQCRKLAGDMKWSGGNIRSALASYNGGRAGNAPGGTLRNEAYVVKVETAMKAIA